MLRCAARPLTPLAPQAQAEVLGKVRIPLDFVAREGTVRDRWALEGAEVSAGGRGPRRALSVLLMSLSLACKQAERAVKRGGFLEESCSTGPLFSRSRSALTLASRSALTLASHLLRPPPPALPAAQTGEVQMSLDWNAIQLGEDALQA